MTPLMIYGAGVLLAAFLLYLLTSGEEITISDVPMMIFGMLTSWFGVVIICVASVAAFVEFHGENKVLFRMPKIGGRK